MHKVIILTLRSSASNWWLDNDHCDVASLNIIIIISLLAGIVLIGFVLVGCCPGLKINKSIAAKLALNLMRRYNTNQLFKLLIKPYVTMHTCV